MNKKETSFPSAIEPWALAELADELKLCYGFSPLSTFTRLEGGRAERFLLEDPLRHIRAELHVFCDTGDANALQSLTIWMLELSKSYDLLIPDPIPGVNGEYVQSLQAGGLPYSCFATAYFGAAKPYSEAEESIAARFSLLGRVAAQLHQISVQWGKYDDLPFPPPPYAAVLDSPGFPLGTYAKEQRRLLGKTAALVQARLAGYGKLPRRFGMVHGSLTSNSVFRVNGRLLVTELDGAIPGWYLYDCSPALAPYLSTPRYEALLEAWLGGYCGIRKLSRGEREIIPTFHMLYLLAELQHGNGAISVGEAAARCRAYLTENG